MRYELKEMNIGDILDLAVRLFRDHFLLFCSISGVIFLPFFLFTGSIVGFEQMFDPTSGQPDFSSLPPSLIITIVVLFVLSLLIYMFFWPLSNAAVTKAVADCYLERSTSFRAAYRAVFHNFWKLATALLLFGVLLCAGIGIPVVIGSVIIFFRVSPEMISKLPGPIQAFPNLFTMFGILCFLLGIFLWIVFMFRYALLPVAVMVENKGGGAALKRSRELMKGNWFKLFILWLVLGVAFGIISAMCNFIPLMYLSVAVSAAFQVFSMTVWQIIFVVLYFHARCQKEAFDLEFLAKSIDAEAPL